MSHYRLQQAANESLSDQTKSLIHYKFGKFRLGQVENGEILLDDFIFEIVNHLNHRSHDPKLLQNTDKRRYLLNLNKLAAKKAVNTCATEQAQVFVRTAFDLLNMENEISTLYNTAFELLMIQGHVEYANNHVDDAIQIFHSAIHKAMTKHHLFEACYHAITAYLSQSKYEQVYQVLYDHVFTSYEELYFLHDQDSTTNPITTTLTTTTNPITTTLTTLHEKVNDDLKSTHTIIMANITHSEYLKHHLDHKMSQMKQQFIQQPLNKNDLLEMIEMKDPESIYLVHLIAQSAPAVYHINKPNAKLEMLLMLLIGTEIVLKKGLCPLAPLILCQVGAMWCLHDFYPPIHVLVEAGVELARNRFKNLHHLASCLLLKEMCYFIFPNINAIEVWNITEEAFLLAIQSNNKSFGGFSILWYPFHHFFYTRSNIKTSIELSKKSMEWYRQVGNYMLLDASQMILEMKRVLSGERETFDPSYCQSQVIEYPFFRQMHYMLKGITCYFQQNYEQAFYCMEKSFEYRQDSACLCSTWIDIVFQGLVACAYQKQLLNQQQPPHQQSPHQPQQQEQQPPQEQQQSTWNTCLLLLEQSSSIQELIQKCQVLIDYSLKMLEQVSQSNPLVFQCSLELIKAEHLHCRSLRYGEENSRSIISGLNKSLKLAIRDRHYLIAKIVNLKIGELYKSLEMDDYISGSYFSKAYDQFSEMGLSIVMDYIWDHYRYQIEEYNRETLSQKMNVGSELYNTTTTTSANTTTSASVQSSSSSDPYSTCYLQEQQQLSLSAITKSRIAEQSELDFKEIFISILPLLSEHTDANRCCLLLKRDSKIYLDAEYHADLYDHFDSNEMNIITSSSSSSLNLHTPSPSTNTIISTTNNSNTTTPNNTITTTNNNTNNTTATPSPTTNISPPTPPQNSQKTLSTFMNHELLIDKLSDRLPLKLIYRTLRTRMEQKNSLQEGSDESYFTKNHRVASALCIPIIRDKSVLGCVYLENRETEGVFTVDKISIAKLIISISIDNATIFNAINKSYARFLPSEFLKLLGKSHVTKIRLGDAISREMTVLFSDIYGFTDLMEKFSAKEGFRFINKLLLKVSVYECCCLSYILITLEGECL